MYSSALTTLLRDARVRLLVVHGNWDIFTSQSQYETWTESLETAEGLSAELRIVTVPGAGHFWHTGTRATLKDTLEAWVSSRS
ncbi:hypothetical protein JVU11DRAFT_4194 [Chiua virens]|nr:hypothetical protein JVU11DRAFT_4194 [Chiua virens]